MRLGLTLSGIVMALGLAGCMSIPSDMTVAEYCANPNKANENVCRLKVEIDGNSTALTDTNMSLAEARMIAVNALRLGEEAKIRAGKAQTRADQAYQLASTAMLKEEDLVCKTEVVQKSAIGTCSPGYTVMGCVQTRYTKRAGGLSFLREVNNEQCRFNSKVLEMNVRCCMAATSASAQYAPLAGGY